MKKSIMIFSAMVVVFFLTACSKGEQDYNPINTGWGFTMSPVIGMAPCEVTFTSDLLSGETCHWDFGDNRSNNADETTPVVITTTSKIAINWEKSFYSGQSVHLFSGVSTVDHGIFFGGTSGHQVYLLRTDGNGGF